MRKGQHCSVETKQKIGLANAVSIDEVLLRRLYVDESLTIKQVTLQMDVSSATVHRNLKVLGIVRSNSEARRLSKPPQSYPERRVPSHPRAHKNGCVKEHILIWEEAHKMPLPEGWIIHHLNGIKNDNRSENLVAMPNGNHCSGLVNAALRQRIRELEAIINEDADN